MHKVTIRRNRRAFTLIELLVVILILGILVAIALPLYLSSIQNAEATTCRANRQTIANAIQANNVRVRQATPTLGVVDAAYITANAPDLQIAPQCASNPPGTLTVVAGVAPIPFGITCSTAGHAQYNFGQP